jgi:hypothetical protein
MYYFLIKDLIKILYPFCNLVTNITLYTIYELKQTENMKIGTKIKITSDNDNYNEFKDQILQITYIAKNKDEHRGYDSGMYPEKLVNLKTMDGKEVGFSLYEYEFEIISK